MLRIEPVRRLNGSEPSAVILEVGQRTYTWSVWLAKILLPLLGKILAKFWAELLAKILASLDAFILVVFAIHSVKGGLSGGGSPPQFVRPSENVKRYDKDFV